jgi:hypothetical protein
MGMDSGHRYLPHPSAQKKLVTRVSAGALRPNSVHKNHLKDPKIKLYMSRAPRRAQRALALANGLWQLAQFSRSRGRRSYFAFLVSSAQHSSVLGCHHGVQRYAHFSMKVSFSMIEEILVRNVAMHSAPHTCGDDDGDKLINVS